MTITNNSINSVIIGPNQKTAFGEMLTAVSAPAIQLQFPYNINTDYVSTTVTGSGTVTQSNSLARIASGAASSSSATLKSLQTIHYGAGQGLSGLFTAVFATGVANNTQIVGLGDDVDGFFFGFNGTAFGVLHRNNSVDTWIAQTAWNGDRFNGTGQSGQTLDVTKGNVYKIQFQWLGFGAINFFIENNATGQLQLCHEIKYTNLNTVPSLANPNPNLFAQSKNTTNTSNVITSVGSMGAFIEGINENIDIRNAINSSKSTITTETSLIQLRNNSTFASKTNKTRITIDQISILNQSTQEGIYRFYLNPTVGGSPSFTNINANTSVVSYDTAGTTVSGGRLLLVAHLAGNDQVFQSLEPYKLNFYPGDRLVVSVATLGLALSLSVGLSWLERF